MPDSGRGTSLFDRGTTAPGPEGDKLRLDAFPFLSSGELIEGEKLVKNSKNQCKNRNLSVSQRHCLLHEGKDSLDRGCTRHIGSVYTENRPALTRGRREGRRKEESMERSEDMGRHEHLLLKEIREMAVPSQPAVRLRFR